MPQSQTDDPRGLSSLISRAAALADDYGVTSTMVGLIGDPGDLLFSEYVHYLQSALRVEDRIFRMTRERVVVHLADVDLAQAEKVVERLAKHFAEKFPAMAWPQLQIHYCEVRPGETDTLRVRDVLTRIFAAETLH